MSLVFRVPGGAFEVTGGPGAMVGALVLLRAAERAQKHAIALYLGSTIAACAAGWTLGASGAPWWLVSAGLLPWNLLPFLATRHLTAACQQVREQQAEVLRVAGRFIAAEEERR